MSGDQPNPYASPATDTSVNTPPQIDPALLKKIEALIKDAGQFWLAVLICTFCSCIGALIIVPWYMARFLQWQSLARQAPLLMDHTAPPGSLARRFQSARGKLIAGIIGGFVVVGVWVLLILISTM